MKKILFLFVLSALLVSCATKKEIQYVDREVIKYNTKYVHDTTVVEKHDSVFHTIFQKGDTIYDTKYVEHTKWRDKIVERVDTCWRDSIRTEYKEVTKEVVKYPKTYWYLLGISLLFVIFAIIKFIRWLKII